jgi:hypothetical protein
MKQKQRKPFFKIETSSLMLCPSAYPCEPAHSLNIQPIHQSRWDFNLEKEKPRFAKKQFNTVL